jgi:hypothetical protein
MRRIKKIALGVFLLAALFIAPVVAKPQNGKGKGQQHPPAFLEGERISLWMASQELDADEPCYVIHGFGSFWTEISPEERREYLKWEYEFRLYIDGEQVELTKFKRFYHVYVNPLGVEYTNFMVFSWYVQFDAGYFESGSTHEFVGEWEKPDGSLSTRTSIVTFT